MAQIYVVPSELDRAAAACTTAAAASGTAKTSLAGTGMPEMPTDLAARTLATLERASVNLGQQQRFLTDEAAGLRSRASAARVIDASGRNPILGSINNLLPGLAGGPDIAPLFKMPPPPKPPPPPKKKEGGSSFLHIVGEVTGVNDAIKAVDDIRHGDVLGALEHTALAAPIPAGRGVKGLKLAKEGVETAAKTGAEDAARHADDVPLKLTNGKQFETLSRQSVEGLTRSSHRAAANKQLLHDLENDPELRRYYDDVLNGNVVEHMRGGKSALRNPMGTEWHHPVGDPEHMILLRKAVHRHPELQHLLHPGKNGSGGYQQHYGGT